MLNFNSSWKKLIMKTHIKYPEAFKILSTHHLTEAIQCYND